MIEDLLSAMVGIEGKYVCVRRGRHKEGNSFYYQLEPSLDASLSVRVLDLHASGTIYLHYISLFEVYGHVNAFLRATEKEISLFRGHGYFVTIFRIKERI